MQDFLKQFFKDLENDPNIKKTTWDVHEGKYPKVTFDLGDSIEEFTIMRCSSVEDIVKALMDNEEDSYDVR